MSCCFLLSPPLCSTTHGHGVSSIALTYGLRHRRSIFRICATTDGVEPKEEEPILPPESPLPSSSSSPSALGKDLKKVRPFFFFNLPSLDELNFTNFQFIICPHEQVFYLNFSVFERVALVPQAYDFSIHAGSLQDCSNLCPEGVHRQ